MRSVVYGPVPSWRLGLSEKWGHDFLVNGVGTVIELGH